MARPISKNELFSDIIGKCYIKMMLDVRNQKRVESTTRETASSHSAFVS